MKKIFIVASLIVFSNTLYSQGFNWDSRMESNHKKFSKVGLSRSAVLPSSYSLEKYLPHTMNQGVSDMCAAYSMATCRTILYARNNDLTDIHQISLEAYSPYYIYYKFKEQSGGKWDGGLGPWTNRMNEYGYAKMKDIEYPYYYPFTKNNLWNFSLPSYVDLDIESVKEDKFDEIHSIYASDDAVDPAKEIVVQMKTELSKGRPLVFGFSPLPTSFSYIGGSDFWSDTNRVSCRAYQTKWKDEYLADVDCYELTNNPFAICDNHRPSDYNESGGHAMVVIAYDDTQYGGAFQILNSWGRDWGDNGKVWIPYNDFIKYSEGIQSFDKEKKSVFASKKKKKSKKKGIILPEDEIGLETKDFSKSISFDWIMFTQMSVEGGDYSGDKSKGIKQGKGIYILPNGLRYEGDWMNNSMHGEGKLVYLDIFKYEGSFKNGVFHGDGILIKYDNWGHIVRSCIGEFENGEFINGKLEEEVSRGYWRGYRYEGEFSNNDFNGNGKMLSLFGSSILEGNFLNGYCDGQGVIKESDGQYEGGWRYSTPYGKGTWTGNDGSIETGIWTGWKITEE